MSKPLLPFLLVAVVAGLGGWFAARTLHPADHNSTASRNSSPTDRKILFYQSAMHPWIKSDKPGKCTICGMDLTPVFEGESGAALDAGSVALGSNAISVLHVKSAPARHDTLRRTLRVSGTLEDNASRHRILSAWVAGRIEKLFVNFAGAEVLEGQPLARFYSPTLLETERQFIALHQSQGQAATSGASADRVPLLQSAERRLRQLGLTSAQIEQLPSKDPANHFSEILAPASGTVVESFVFAGQYVMEGEKLFELADFSTLWFLFDAYEQDLPWLAPGQEVAVTTAAAPGQVFRAPIQFINPNLNEPSRSAKVRVEIPNPVVATNSGLPTRLLRHRLLAEGRIELAFPNLLVVPRSAVLSPSDQPVVVVELAEGVYQQRPVRLGRFGDTHYEVLAGLSPEERVVVQGNLMIDAQAQLNQAIQTAAARPETVPGSPNSHADAPAPLDPATIATLQSFLAAADTLRAALAHDDLAAFHRATDNVNAAREALEKVLAPLQGWSPLIQAVQLPAASSPVGDLRSARKAYHPFSKALVELARRLRTQQSAFKELKIYRCPMTADAFDGAPARAEWLQFAAPIRNPWFGAEMLECGVEVRD